MNIDTKLLTLFIAVYDSQSVSAAARALNLNQSTVSNSLERMRKLIGDPLFVRAGKGIVPTTHADLMVPSARLIVQESEKLLSTYAQYEPGEDKQRFTISTSDYEWSVIGSALTAMVREEAPQCELMLTKLGTVEDMVNNLRCGKVDVCITKSLNGDSTELYERKLFEDPMVAFYDPAYSAVPARDAYWKAHHARIVFSDDEKAVALFQQCTNKLIVPNFSYLAFAIKGSDLVATVPSLLHKTFLANLAVCELPFEYIVRVHATWHMRNHNSARHRWFLKKIQRAAGSENLAIN